MSDRAPSAAEDARAQAEAAKFEAEADKARHEARVARAEADQAELELDKAREKRERERHADAYADRSYRFYEPVTGASVAKCITQLAAWHRQDPTCDLEIVFNSPGGDVVEGMDLYDYIQDLRDAGHDVTTRTRGMAASMAGILLQAGNTRVMGPQASLMIHEASFGAHGKTGDVEDTVEWVNKVQDRILHIFAERAAATDAPKKLTYRQLKNRWRRKNWWLDASEALEFGLVDEIR